MGSERDLNRGKDVDPGTTIRQSIDSIYDELDDLRDALVFEELVMRRRRLNHRHRCERWKRSRNSGDLHRGIK